MKRHAASLLAGFVLFVVASASVRAAEPQAQQPAPPAAASATAESEPAAPDCHQAEFAENDRAAGYLLDYDRAAWLTTDLLRAEPDHASAKLSREWFCYEDAGVWHAVYGYYEEGKPYEVAYHYVAKGKTFERSKEAPDPARVALYPAVLHAAEQRLPEQLKQYRGFFNVYVRPLKDGKIEVRYIPAQQEQFVVVGADLAYIFDAATQAFVRADEAISERGLEGIKRNAKGTLGILNLARDAATPGQIFQVRSLRRQFKMIIVFSKRCSTTALEQDGQFVAWMHVLREDPPAAAKAPQTPPAESR